MNWISDALSISASVTKPRSKSGRLQLCLSSIDFQSVLRLCSDLIALSVAEGLFFLAIQHQLISTIQFSNNIISRMALIASVVLVLYLFGAYGAGYLRSPERELERTVKAVCCSFFLFVLYSICDRPRVPSFNFSSVYLYLTALFLILCGRFGLRTVMGWLWNSDYARRDVLLVGSPRAICLFQRHLAILRYRGSRILGWIPIGLSDSESPVDLPEIVNAEESRAIISNMKPQVVLVDGFGLTEDRSKLIALIETCRLHRVAFKLSSEFFEMPLAEEFEGRPDTLSLRKVPRWSALTQRAWKWLFDRVLGLAGSLFTVLIAPVVWLLISLEDPGPLFHRREFVAQDGSIRYYLKFRTMVRDADEILDNDPEMKKRFSENHKLRDDPRTLKVGRIFRKFSIDEFPQFFSVLTGQLAFVGPRVICEAEKVRYGRYLEKRLTVKPGLTGYWQVMGRQTTTYDERILMDMHYIDNWSIWMDLVIVGETFGKFFAQKGAY